MEIENQEKIWDKIAPEWHVYKQIPSEASKLFLENAKGKVLDLGSGSGRHLTKIKNGKMYLLDISSEMLNLAKDKSKKENIDAEFIHSSMDVIPIEDNFFDYAISISSLHCVEGKDKRKKAISELYRVLKKSGRAYIGVWNINSKRFKRKAKGNKKEQLIGWTDKGNRYYYLYDEEEIHKEFVDAGFKIVSSHNSEMMINFIVEKD